MYKSSDWRIFTWSRNNMNCAELTNCQKQYFTGEITSAKVLATDGFNLNCSRPECPANMKYTNCGGCERTCEHKPMIICNLMCHFRCACNFGLVWSTKMKMCVLPETCVSMEPPPFAQ